MKEQLASYVRHYLVPILGLGGFLAGLNFFTPDEAKVFNEAAHKLIEPLTGMIVLLLIAASRWMLFKIPSLFRSGAGEPQVDNSGKSGGAMPLLLLACTAAALLGGLPSCSPVLVDAARSIPIRIGIQGPDVSASYSSKSGLQVDAVIRPAK